MKQNFVLDEEALNKVESAFGLSLEKIIPQGSNWGENLILFCGATQIIISLYYPCCLCKINISYVPFCSCQAIHVKVGIIINERTFVE